MAGLPQFDLESFFKKQKHPEIFSFYFMFLTFVISSFFGQLHDKYQEMWTLNISMQVEMMF